MSLEKLVRYFRDVAERRKANPRLNEADARPAMDILLDSRSEPDLMKQIRSAYTKLGVRL